jgi:MFS family permease
VNFRSWLSISHVRPEMDILLFGGLIGSLFSFLQFLSSPLIGRWSDKYGRRKVLLLSMIGNALSMALWVFAKSFSIFVLSRIVGGLTEGNVQMSIAMISDLTPPETRSKNLV